MLKTIDFPVKPHVRKYLNVHLGTEAYVLSNSGRFGRMLFHLMRRQVKGKLHHAGSREDCTSALALDLRNFPVHQYGLTELTDYTIFQFNDYCDEWLKEELYTWVRQFVNRRTTIKQVITDFMAGYDLREEDIQYETLRKAVQRNVDLAVLKKKGPKSVGKMSQKTADLSRKSADLSQKTADLSRYSEIRALRQQLKKEEV
ncbi:hypothetical protein J0X19_22085 [Hymenobacter sp. BT186]|uniref:Uncharacterized protein n=1 Tax=Hymenobacter telluris TaxID=2816474 RepID=A0A939F0T2_9BACT|nr:hypothetical protein [Hymenobacter telluris]MBO0360666.1 hypothetical protein [Hymenobacter telluris]MBW3376693.1 hypothetical protein [Hymenobacter norwichensis]